MPAAHRIIFSTTTRGIAYIAISLGSQDASSTGDLTLEELIKGAQTDPEFQSRLRVMDIDAADLEQLFEMMLASKGDTLGVAGFGG